MFLPLMAPSIVPPPLPPPLLLLHREDLYGHAKLSLSLRRWIRGRGPQFLLECRSLEGYAEQQVVVVLTLTIKKPFENQLYWLNN